MSNIKSWSEIARDSQKFPKGDWALWMILAGRGFGKTRTGAESVMELVNSGQYKRIALIGKTIAEVKSIMVEGISGILSTTVAKKMFQNKEDCIDDPTIIPFRYYKSKNQIVWENGAVAHLISADNYESMRGLQFDLIWVDEFAKFSHPEEIWLQVMLTLRLGEDPRCIMTTTPRPLQVLKDLVEDEKTHLTSGSTFENESNLSAKFLETIKAKYEHTTLGAQEIFGQIILDNSNRVWKPETIKYREMDKDCMERIVIGVDPSVTVSEKSDETGIIVAGMGFDDKMYVLDDLSGKYEPAEWAKQICIAFREYEASNIIVETNNGGDLVKEMIKSIDPNIPISEVKAIKNKASRAHPISLLYESNRIFHTRYFEELEKQMCELAYNEKPKKSPDRVDALVWAIQDLRDISNKINNECHITVI